MKKIALIVLLSSTFLLALAPAIVQAKNSIKSSTQTITYFYSKGSLSNEEDDSGLMSAYLEKSARSIIDMKNNTIVQTSYLITDGKSIVSQVDSDALKIINTKQYTPYGKLVDYASFCNLDLTTHNLGLSLQTNPYKYNTYHLDSESGLYYLNARYYSPILMQFISRDTYDLPNRYSYCEGNPISHQDPSGHLSITNAISGIIYLASASINFSTGNLIGGGIDLAATDYAFYLAVKLEHENYRDLFINAGTTVLGVLPMLYMLKRCSEVDTLDNKILAFRVEYADLIKKKQQYDKKLLKIISPLSEKPHKSPIKIKEVSEKLEDAIKEKCIKSQNLYTECKRMKTEMEYGFMPTPINYNCISSSCDAQYRIYKSVTTQPIHKTILDDYSLLVPSSDKLRKLKVLLRRSIGPLFCDPFGFSKEIFE